MVNSTGGVASACWSRSLVSDRQEGAPARMRTAEFDYELPPGRVAQEPAPERTAARMLVLDRAGGPLRHTRVRDLPGFLRAGDLLVLNDTRVIPARVRGRKAETGGRVELLMVKEVAPRVWEALCRASRPPRVGSQLRFAGDRLTGRVVGHREDGRVLVAWDGAEPVTEILEQVGEVPLPPYIKRPGSPNRGDGADAAQRRHDRERYQTVYAREPGAVAAPTAGLHFTRELLAALQARGVEHVMLTLHVGPGTFKPVTTEDIAAHCMEAERFGISPATAERINATRAGGGRVVAVGTTVVRALEAAADDYGRIRPGHGETELFICPPYRFRAVDVMLTNFHLPRSTPLVMVCAFAGRAPVMAAYREALREGYRFYSYGDCMLIL